MFLPTPTAAALVNTERERLAHEQFIEQNAWARPQAPIIHAAHGITTNTMTPGISHTPDWAEPNLTGSGAGSAKHLMRNLSGFATPVPLPKRAPQLEHSSSGTVVVNSDGLEPEVPSSVLAQPSTSTGERILSSLQHGNQMSSPLTGVMKLRQQQSSGPELTGFRNVSGISGISGVSTIDAPLQASDPADAQERWDSGPAETSAHQRHQQRPPFASGQHGHGDAGRRDREREREAFPIVGGFRPQVGAGAFGTPVPGAP